MTKRKYVSTTKQLLKNLVDLDTDKPVYIVHRDYKRFFTNEKCDECNGTGKFKHGTKTYTCNNCDGIGKLSDVRHVFLATRYSSGGYPEISLQYNEVQLAMYHEVRGFFNSENEAQKLAGRLNSLDEEHS